LHQKGKIDMTERIPRFARWDAAHALCFAGVATLLGAFANRLNSLSLESQLLTLGALAIVIGVPHGALDMPIARRWLMPRWGWAWAPVFVAVYLIVAAPVAVGWMVVPGMTLGFFLLTAIYHFGVSDTERGGLPPKRRFLEGMARGLAPVVVTAWARPAEVQTLFSHLAGPQAAFLLAGAAVVLGPATLVLLVAAAVLRLADLRHSDKLDRRRAWTKGLELAALPLVFISLAPLLAFTLYWIGLHSLHVLLIAASKQERSGTPAAWSAYRPALPATVATLALAALAYVAFFHGRTFIAAGLAIIFMGLSVLNTPHMLFVTITARYR
jgi:Brp/Blh family beta-carotene 15,15'-monooxygenase